SFALIVIPADLEVCRQQLKHRQISRGFAVRDRESLQHRPARRGNRLKFMEQSRLANTRVGHCGNDLAASRLDLLSRELECVHLAFAADELGKSARGRALKVSTQWSKSGHRKYFDRLTYPFYHRWAERLESQ